MGVVQGSFGVRSGVVQGSFGGLSGVVQGSFGGRSGVVRGSFGRTTVGRARKKKPPGKKISGRRPEIFFHGCLFALELAVAGGWGRSPRAVADGAALFETPGLLGSPVWTGASCWVASNILADWLFHFVFIF